MLIARADWLVRKWIASFIHLRAAYGTKSRVESLISDHDSVYWKWVVFTNTIINLSVGKMVVVLHNGK